MSRPVVHERDCAPCDAARAVYDELAVDGHGGTLADQAVRIIATVLHRYPLGGPP